MSKDQAQDTDPNTALSRLLFAAAPEQKLHLDGIFRQYDLKVVVQPDSRGPRISAIPGQVQFDNKTMQVYWLLGFAGWRVIECYTPALFAPLCGLGSLRECLDADTGLPEVENAYRERLHVARTLL